MSERGNFISKLASGLTEVVTGNYHEPEVARAFKRFSWIAKIAEGWALILGMEKVSESLDGPGLSPEEKAGLTVMVVGGLALVANIAVDVGVNIAAVRGRNKS